MSSKTATEVTSYNGMHLEFKAMPGHAGIEGNTWQCTARIPTSHDSGMTVMVEAPTQTLCRQAIMDIIRIYVGKNV